MKETLDAVFENGVLRPLRKLSLPNGRRLRITLESRPDDFGMEGSNNEEIVTDIASFAGSLKDSPRFAADPLTIQKRLRDEWA